MKLYVVIGVEYHVGRKLLGIYDSHKLAVERQNKAEENPYEFDKILITTVELNKGINEI